MTWVEENQAMFGRVNRAAWIRTGALGDLIVGLASLAEMPNFFPKAKIIVVGPRLFCELIDPSQFPWIEAIAVTERKSVQSRMAYPAPGGGATKWVLEDTAQPLKSVLKKCDAAVNTHIDSYRYGIEALKARVPIRIGSAPATMSWLYTHASPFFGKDPLIHERDLSLLLLEYATPRAIKFLRTIDRNRRNLQEWVERSKLVAKWRGQGLPGMISYDPETVFQVVGLNPGRYFLVNPTASRREKTWPTTKLRQLLLECMHEFKTQNVEPVVIGAPHETDWLREVARGDIRFVQPNNLFELQNIVWGAKMLLTNGSSMQFIAGTTSTPVLTIFGRGQPIVWGPVGPNDLTVRAKFDEADQGSTFAGFEEEARIYETIEVGDVKQKFLSLICAPQSEKFHHVLGLSRDIPSPGQHAVDS